MRVTPLDIRKQEFRKTMRGLDSDEVYAFLNTVAEEYEIVLSDNKRFREHVFELEERIKEYKGMEDNLRNTLLTAERVTAEAKENARREAGLLIREAEVEAEKELRGALTGLWTKVAGGVGGTGLLATVLALMRSLKKKKDALVEYDSAIETLPRAARIKLGKDRPAMTAAHNDTAKG